VSPSGVAGVAGHRWGARAARQHEPGRGELAASPSDADREACCGRWSQVGLGARRLVRPTREWERWDQNKYDAWDS
jgi:hypothetical protein